MKQVEVHSFNELLELLDRFSSLRTNITLYRGQDSNYDLLPSIARRSNVIDVTEREFNMLGELKRRVVDTTLLGVLKTDWDWLIYGQHYGLKTRLLDWTSNPLISLWFSLMENRRDGYLYILSINKSNTISDISQSPFELEKNEILKPNFNNRRIVSQSGWFSVHPYSVESGEYIPLNKCENLSNKIIEVKIPKRYTSDFVKKLDTMGINSEFIFQDVAGICNHINWQYKF